jgi:hypothetical protein
MYAAVPCMSLWSCCLLAGGQSQLRCPRIGARIHACCIQYMLHTCMLHTRIQHAVPHSTFLLSHKARCPAHLWCSARGCVSAGITVLSMASGGHHMHSSTCTAQLPANRPAGQSHPHRLQVVQLAPLLRQAARQLVVISPPARGVGQAGSWQ